MLNHKSPVPLYHQMADILINKIRVGEYQPGSVIPSEHSLALTYHVSRPTARQATDLLVRKRVLVRKRGAGTFVRTDHREIDLFSLAGTMSAFQKEGIVLSPRIIHNLSLKKIAEDSENPFSGKNAFFISRLSSVDETPVLIEDIYFDASVFAGLDRINIKGQSLSRIVHDHYYMQPSGGRQNFRIISLSGKKAGYLSLPGNHPVLLVKRFLHFPQADNAVYSELFCRTDRFVFSQTIGGFPDD